MFARFFYNRMPWWLFAMTAFGALGASIVAVSDAVQTQMAMQDVAQTPPEAVIPLSQLTPDDAVNSYGEVSVAGRFAGVEGILTGSGPDKHYLLIEPETGEGPALVVLDVGLNRKETLAAYAERTGPGGALELSGFLQTAFEEEAAVRAKLRAAGRAGDQTLYLIEPYWGSRTDALWGFRMEKWGFAAVSIALSLVLLWMTLDRFRTWRRNVAEKRQKAEAAKDAQWQDGPIQSAKVGWFR